MLCNIRTWLESSERKTLKWKLCVKLYNDGFRISFQSPSSYKSMKAHHRMQILSEKSTFRISFPIGLFKFCSIQPHQSTVCWAMEKTAIQTTKMSHLETDRPLWHRNGHINFQGVCVCVCVCVLRSVINKPITPPTKKKQTFRWVDLTVIIIRPFTRRQCVNCWNYNF